MKFQTSDFLVAAPEIFVLSMICLVLLVDLFTKQKNKMLTYSFAQLTLFGAATLSLIFFPETKTLVFNNLFVSDPLSTFLKLFIYFSGVLTFFYVRKDLRYQFETQGEYYLLCLFSMLGMMVLVSAQNLITLYLGLEILSLPLYALVAMRRKQESSVEAGLKYFVMGSLASGIFLFGLSLIYGATGTLDLNGLATLVVGASTLRIVFGVGLVFVISGIAFKLAAAPFHMWLPDVYQGSSNVILVFLGSASKIAAFGFAVRLLVDGMPALLGDWQQFLIVLSVLSIAFGNLTAIVQKNIKRMLGYSAIAHTGYMLLGMVSGTSAGYSSAMFYMLNYAIMSLGVFGVLICLSYRGKEIEEIDDLSGLGQRNGPLAFVMLILMFSMIGVPPTAGFFAKFYVLAELINTQHIVLAVFALIFSVIGAFYYLRVVNKMYFSVARKDVFGMVLVSRFSQMVAVLNGLLVLAIGLFPALLMQWCRLAFANF